MAQAQFPLYTFPVARSSQPSAIASAAAVAASQPPLRPWRSTGFIFGPRSPLRRRSDSKILAAPMGEEVPDAARDRIAAEGFGGYGRGRVSKWEVGIPTEYERFHLTKPLVSPGLAAAFRIGSQPSRTAVDVDREV